MKNFALRQLLSILLLPVLVTLVVPALILWQNPQLNPGWGLSASLSAVLALVGILFLIAGSVLLFWTISLFVSQGGGTIAPWDPTRKLVLRGPYRHVRNPMISGVLAVLLAEAILTGSVSLLVYLAFAAVLNFIYIPLSEEPGMQRRFGSDYNRYKQHVPRWMPRLKPWEGEED